MAQRSSLILDVFGAALRPLGNCWLLGGHTGGLHDIQRHENNTALDAQKWSKERKVAPRTKNAKNSELFCAIA